MSQRWTLSGIAITALAAMATLISTGTAGALATVLIWALALVVTVILLNLAWTFPVFRGFVYDNADLAKERRKRRRGRKWIADIYLTGDGFQTGGAIAFSVITAGPEIRRESIGRVNNERRGLDRWRTRSCGARRGSRGAEAISTDVLGQ